MPTAYHLQINRQQLQDVSIHREELPELAPGEALLEIEQFALTANNITYAVFGHSLRYWQFFPAAHAVNGRLPAWGFATVSASRAVGVAVGQRYYGYYPAGSHLIVQPFKASQHGFADGAAHRAELPLIYNQYLDCSQDPQHLIDRPGAEALLRPLFTTSFLIAQSLLDRGSFAAHSVVLTSASSKTALATAFVLRELGVPLTRVGLTSAANRSFVEQLGVYDQVVDYADLSALEHLPSAVSIDFAGNGVVLARIHARLGARLRHSWLVGGAHWQARDGAAGLIGVRPEVFFAPTVAQHYLQQFGRGELQKRIHTLWQPFVEFASGLLKVIETRGPEALHSAYLQLLDNQIPAAHGLIIRP